MDDFRRAKSDIITALDLDVSCIVYRRETRRQFMKIANRRARRRLKRELQRMTISGDGQ